MWYFKPFACLYDLLQFGFGHLNGLVTMSEFPGRESVVEGMSCGLDVDADDAEDKVGEEIMG